MRRDRRRQDPRQILDERLADGEIDAAQYQKLRDLIARDEQHETPVGSGSRR